MDQRSLALPALPPLPAGGGSLRPQLGPPELEVPSREALQQQLQGAAAAPARPKKIVVLGWKGHVEELVVGWRRPGI